MPRLGLLSETQARSGVLNLRQAALYLQVSKAHISNLINLQSDESVKAFLSVKDFVAYQFIVMVTKNGVIKKCELTEFNNPLARGIIAMALDEGIVRLWDASAAKVTGTLRGHEGPVWAVAFAPDSKAVATGGSANARVIAMLTDCLIEGIARDVHDHTLSPACLCNSSQALALVCRGTPRAHEAAEVIAPLLRSTWRPIG